MKYARRASKISRDTKRARERDATRDEIFILLSDSCEQYASKRDNLIAVKRLIISHARVYRLIATRNRISNHAYNVSIESSLTSDELLEILIALRENKLILQASFTREDNLE